MAVGGGCNLGWWLKSACSEILVVLEDVCYTGGNRTALKQVQVQNQVSVLKEVISDKCEI